LERFGYLAAAGPPRETWLVKILYWTDIFIFLAFALFVVFHEPWSAHYFIGLGVAIAGFALSILARVQLGHSFSIRPQARKVE